MKSAQLPPFLVICLTILLAGVGVSPVFAVSPISTPFTIERSREVVGECDGFQIIENATITGTETTYFDKAGNPTRIQIHGQYRGTLTNSVTGAYLVDAPDPILAVIDLRNETFALKGLHYRITVPGQGIVVLDAGTATFYADGTIVTHGPAPDYAELPQLLCSLLGAE